jgi:PTH1 family peptidyl-tRNA hydrolase
MVVGLGNPGRRYERSRHNVGFEVVDRLAADAGGAFRRRWRAKALVARVELAGQDAVLVKPETYMNRSGFAVSTLLRRQGLGVDRLLVVVDDVDLDLGRLRIRAKGSAGSHNGLKSIVAALGSTEFARVRVGVGGKPEGGDMVDHVLRPMSSKERATLAETVVAATEAVEAVLREGLDWAMNKFNG